MVCKWCNMESATPDRCSWCNGVLEAERPAEAAAETGNEATAGEAPAESADSRPNAARFHTPAPPIPAAGFNRMPAPPVPPRPPQQEAPPADSPAPFMAGRSEPEPLTGLSAPNFMPPPSETRSAFAAEPTRRDAPEEESPLVGLNAPQNAPADAPARTTTGLHFSQAPDTEEIPAIGLNNPVGLNNPAAEPPALTLSRLPAEPAEEVGLAAGVAKPVERPAAGTVDLEALKATAPAGRMSKYYEGKTVEETTGIGANEPVAPRETPRSTKPERIELEFDKPETPAATLWLRFAGAYAGVLLVAGVLAFATKSMLLPIVLANFAGGMLLPLLRVAPWQDEDSDDAIFLFLLTLIFGPLVSLVVYGVVGVIKQMANPAVWGCFLVGAVTRVVVEAASGNPILQPLTPLQLRPFALLPLITQWGSLFGLAGWFVANTFHKLDE